MKTTAATLLLSLALMTTVLPAASAQSDGAWEETESTYNLVCDELERRGLVQACGFAPCPDVVQGDGWSLPCNEQGLVEQIVDLIEKECADARDTFDDNTGRDSPVEGEPYWSNSAVVDKWDIEQLDAALEEIVELANELGDEAQAQIDHLIWQINGIVEDNTPESCPLA